MRSAPEITITMALIAHLDPVCIGVEFCFLTSEFHVRKVLALNEMLSLKLYFFEPFRVEKNRTIQM